MVPLFLRIFLIARSCVCPCISSGAAAAGGLSVARWDGIIGFKGRVWLGRSNWSIPYCFDVGTGSSSLTWQGMLGVAYSYKWLGVTLAYRHLYYDQKDDKLVQDIRFSGPALGVTFRF